MLEGVDYAFSSPDPDLLFRAGKRFAMRYVGPGTDDKHLHADERDELWAAGLSIVLLAEGAENGAFSGSIGGQLHAQSAQAAARALGAPDSLPIYFAVDFDATAAQWPIVASYLRAVGTVLGPSRVGVYGGIRSMQWAARDRVAQWFFQTYAWSAGQWFAGNHVEQYLNGVALAGGEVDLCRAKAENFGQWTKEADMASEWHTGDEDGPFLTQGNPGYVKQQRDTALAFAWERAAEASDKADKVLAKLDEVLAALGNAAPGVAPHTHEGGTSGPVAE